MKPVPYCIYWTASCEVFPLNMMLQMCGHLIFVIEKMKFCLMYNFLQWQIGSKNFNFEALTTSSFLISG